MDFIEIKKYRDSHVIDVVLDTDTFNETDDQYAIAYMLQYSQKLRVRALYAAPFANGTLSDSPGEGMEKSYLEIQKIVRLAKRTDLLSSVYRGSKSWLKDEKTPVDSEAARHLVSLASEYSPEHPLFVVAIGAITNVASALLMQPKIAENIVLVWLGGTAFHVGSTMEFNMIQDISAVRAAFTLAKHVVQLPCEGVVSEFLTTIYETEHWLLGQNELCDYLCGVLKSYAVADRAWSRVIWDVTAIAWLLNEGDKFLLDREEPMRLPNHHKGYDIVKDKNICYIYKVFRDELYTDLFKKLRMYR